ncbi:MAG: carbon-nitrogen hydrolase family protein [Bacillota bacterium]|nr:carbon-nitrogen hydrolase family protein [Bacillota bacterium]
MNNMKIAQIQMKVYPDKEKNLKEVEKYLENMKEENTDIVVLPEMFNCPYDKSLFEEYSEKQGGKTWSKLSELAEKYNIYLFAGSIPEKVDSGEVYNTSYIFDRKGKQIGKHRKVHLFDIDIEGGQTFIESEILTPGKDLTVVDTEFGKIGLMICYDIRFPEWSRLMSLKGAQVIIVPGAFNMTTGPAHWEISFRVRALDNQVFTVGTAPAQDKEASYTSYGNSILVSPWGKIIDRMGYEDGYIINDIDLREVKEVRKQLPLLQHRRTDLYDIIEK